MSGARSFPYWTPVNSFELQQGPLQPGVRPGHQPSAPRTFEEGGGFAQQPPQQGVTDFTSWTEAQIKAFLDQRGEDFDDCTTFPQLVVRAQECEVSTGPAPDPNQSQAPGGAEAGDAGDDEDYDPLDAFMAGIETEVKANKQKAKPKLDMEEDEDNVADYLEARKATGATTGAVASAYHGTGYNSDEEVYATAKAVDRGADVDFDENDNPIVGEPKTIEPLPPLDHSIVEYDEFEKDFYTPSPTIAALKDHEVNAIRRQLDIHVSGFDCARPIQSFRHCGFDARLMSAITKQGYTQPTPIQAQAIPAALSGRDILGVAKTGSGKTAAFVLPMMVHIMDQPELEKGEGPIGIIVAPTRELSEQIHKETRKFSKPYGLRCVAAFGGLSKHEQFKHLKTGSEVAVCTPGRMIDLIKMKACTCRRATYLVFDEADRMFDMGFEPQVRSIIGQIRPDRQTMLFSATMPKKVERLAREALIDPIRVTVGRVGGANEDINQVVEVMADDAAKYGWLLAKMPAFVDAGDVMVFVNQKARVDELVAKLKGCGFKVDGVHGDHDQHTRMETLRKFRSGELHVLVATDVAARGLDIKSIKTVVNMDAPKDIDTYVHRIGRTGRAGEKDGVAYTFVLQTQSNFAGELVHALVASNQSVPKPLHELAMKSGRFRHGGSRGGGGRGGGGKGGRGRGRRQVGGAGLGFSDDPPPPTPEPPGPPGLPTSSVVTPGGDSLPPPPPLHHQQRQQMAGFVSSTPSPAPQPAVQGFVASSTPAASRPRAGMAGFVSASPSPAPAPVAQQPSREQVMSQMRKTGTTQLKSLYSNRFKTSFVASSTGAVQPDAPVATVVAPRRQPAQAAPPPPLPAAVAAAPAIAAQQMIAARYSSAAPSTGFSQPAPASGPAFNAAIAAAQAVAARLANPGGAAGAPELPPAESREERRKRKWDS